MDLYQEIRSVSNPLLSRSMVVILRIANSPGMQVLRQCASSIGLMDPRFLPREERRWTCRVWVKQFLLALHNRRYVELPSSIGKESDCLYSHIRC